MFIYQKNVEISEIYHNDENMITNLGKVIIPEIVKKTQLGEDLHLKMEQIGERENEGFLTTNSIELSQNLIESNEDSLEGMEDLDDCLRRKY